MELTVKDVSDLNAWNAFGVMTAMFGLGGHTLPVEDGSVTHLLLARTPNDVLENLKIFGIQFREGENARVLNPYFKRITNLLRVFISLGSFNPADLLYLPNDLEKAEERLPYLSGLSVGHILALGAKPST